MLVKVNPCNQLVMDSIEQHAEQAVQSHVQHGTTIYHDRVYGKISVVRDHDMFHVIMLDVNSKLSNKPIELIL